MREKNTKSVTKKVAFPHQKSMARDANGCSKYAGSIQNAILSRFLHFQPLIPHIDGDMEISN